MSKSPEELAAIFDKFRNIEKPEIPAADTDCRGTVRLPGRTVRLRHAIGDTVFHRLADSRVPGLVTGLLIRPGGVLYYVTWPGRSEHAHYELELADDYTPDYKAG